MNLWEEMMLNKMLGKRMTFWEEVTFNKEQMEASPKFRAAFYAKLFLAGIVGIVMGVWGFDHTVWILIVPAIICLFSIPLDLLIRYFKNRPRW